MDKLIIMKTLTANLCAEMKLEIPRIILCDSSFYRLASIDFRRVNGKRQPDLICINTYLLEFLDTEPLEFLLAHELAHGTSDTGQEEECDALAARIVGKEKGIQLYKELRLFCETMECECHHPPHMWIDRLNLLSNAAL